MRRVDGRYSSATIGVAWQPPGAGGAWEVSITVPNSQHKLRYRLSRLSGVAALHPDDLATALTDRLADRLKCARCATDVLRNAIRAAQSEDCVLDDPTTPIRTSLHHAR